MAYKRVNWQDYPSKATPLNAENLNKMDEGIANLDAESEALKAFGNEGKLVYVHDGALDTLEPSNLDLHVGSPTVVTEAAQMTDSSKIYVYNGSETGMETGHWYYYDGTQWQDGGAWNAPEIETDKTLSVTDKPADGKAVGINLNLQIENIPGTTQTIAFDSFGNVQSITHTKNNAAVRTDVFTFGTNTITEVRTLSSGESLTITTNTLTLQTTVTYVPA